MSKRRKRSSAGTMLELWRPPQGAGEAIGCLATSYTFEPGLFDEQCLSRFLGVESEPNREDLAFLLERETRLGAAYAGVLIDHTQAGVDHSLRWDVLPIRIWGGKQHAKLSLLVWTGHVRVIVASANLTEAGYRCNREVAMSVDNTPRHGARGQVEAAVQFLRCLLAFVPGARPNVPAIHRAHGFLDQVERQVAGWLLASKSEALRQHLVFTLPQRDDNPASGGPGFASRGSLEEAVSLCLEHGSSPEEAWIASPFFDIDSSSDMATSVLCKAMTDDRPPRLTFCVPALGSPEEKPVRLAAPMSLRTTPGPYSAQVGFRMLPQDDEDGNRRVWHAKMLAFRSSTYSALLVGSSNFTQAGLGIGPRRNAEANVLTIAPRQAYARAPGDLEAIWPEMDRIDELDSVEWLGPKSEEEDQQAPVLLPPGFLTATYRAGDQRRIILRFDPTHLPVAWSVHACGQTVALLLDAETWAASAPQEVALEWPPVQPPEKLLVRWADGEAFWTLNVEDPRQLPPPARLEEMTADDMLLVLAASDPGAAFRAWVQRQGSSDGFDEELDTATPTDLDPLRRYDLRATFLHRIRSRARVLARVRQNLQRPVWSVQALQWRLEGFIGIKPLAQRLLGKVTETGRNADEATLTLSDFLIVLREVDYQEIDGALPKVEFERVYHSFLRSLVAELDGQVRGFRGRIGKQMLDFWDRVVERCQA